jgi:hypothetical protein
MPTFLVFKKIVFPMKTLLITLTGAEGTEESRGFGAMHFPFVTLETGFIAERCFGAWRLGAGVWTDVFVLVLSGILLA